jgi:eukaryotic-like serine/threonine-protein kinase
MAKKKNQQIGRYKILGELGRGAMGVVYRARDPALDREVALKTINLADEAEERIAYEKRFFQEAKAAGKLTHPNIVTTYDFGEEEGVAYLAMELLEGTELRSRLKEGALPPAEAIDIARQVADALGFAHEHGVVHRDVKPQNVLLSRDGEIKVTDFGIARSLDAESGLTVTGTVLGTSSYLSPEQASGLRVTPAADVYSLGVVLYELLAGEVPFPGGNQVVVALKHVNEPPPSLLERRPDVPVRLASAVARALQKDPEQRFASMDDFAAELRACLAGLESPDVEVTMVTAPPPVTRVARKGRRRMPLVAALLGLAAIAAAVVALVLTARHEGPPAAAGSGGGSVTLRGVTAYDPDGTGPPGEDNSHAPLATDGDQATFWSTEIYSSPAFGNLKPGVGLVLDAGSAVKLGSVTVTTDTPGYTALIMAGDSVAGPFSDDSSSQTVGASTTFQLNGATAQYYVIWITRLPPGDAAHVNEATAG